MVRRSMYNKIQDLKRKGKSRRNIAKTLGIDPKTVRKYYEMSAESHQQMLTNANASGLKVTIEWGQKRFYFFQID